MHNSSLFSSVPGLLILLALVILASYSGAALIAAFLLLVLLISLCACLWSQNILKKTHVSIDEGQTACHAGDTIPLTLRVHSKSVFPLIWLDVLLPLGQALVFSREDEEAPQPYTLPTERPLYALRERFVWLLWQHEITCEETLIAHRRGVVQVTRVCLQAGDALGLSAAQRFAPLERPVTLIAYPRLYLVDIKPFLRLLSDAETGPRGQMEDITLLKSSRPYQHGDPMKRINWRYLAMTGRMEINQYETVSPGCITFLVDLFSFRYIETYTTPQDTQETRVALRAGSLERMLSVVASCIRAMQEQGLRFALIIPGYGSAEPVVIRPGSHETTLIQAMEALAAVDYRGEVARLPADDLRRLRRKLGVIELCSYSDTPSVLDAMEALSCTRLRCIACLRGSDAQTAMECTLAGDIADMNDRAPQDVQKGGAA